MPLPDYLSGEADWKPDLSRSFTLLTAIEILREFLDISEAAPGGE